MDALSRHGVRDQNSASSRVATRRFETEMEKFRNIYAVCITVVLTTGIQWMHQRERNQFPQHSRDGRHMQSQRSVSTTVPTSRLMPGIETLQSFYARCIVNAPVKDPKWKHRRKYGVISIDYDSHWIAVICIAHVFTLL
jgi:hypothetical protein